MADTPQKTMANRTDRAETEMFLRRVLLKYGYDNLPDNTISGALMRLGPLGDIAGMMGMDFLSRALTPKGTNIPPAGAVMVTGEDGVQKAVPLIELFDVAMVHSKNQAAKGMAGEAITMTAASTAGLSMAGPAGWLVMAVGQLLGRSSVFEKIPIVKDIFSALKSAFTPPGTNLLTTMNTLQLSREMVTFTRAKLIDHEGLILSGKDIEQIAKQPTKDANALTAKFDRIWRLEEKLTDPSQGPLHQLVQSLADYADKSPNPMTILSRESFDNDPQHPFHSTSAAVKSPAWEIATDSILSLSGIPDLSTANTGHVMATHRAAMIDVKDSELNRAQQAGKELPAENFANKDWSKVPDNQIVVIGTKYNKQGIQTDAFRSMQTPEGTVFFGDDGKGDSYGKRYSAQEFAQLVKEREPLISVVQITQSRTPLEWIFPKNPEANTKPPVAPDPSRFGKPVQFASVAETQPDAPRGRLSPSEMFPARVELADEKSEIAAVKLQPAQTLG